MTDHNGILYIVSTPIGNLQDISIRALKVLSSVDFIACEDTRRTGLLLSLLQKQEETASFIKTGKKFSFISYFEQNEKKRIPQIISILSEGKNVALVSDAGTPLISDPGFKLVRECIANSIKVEAVPGPSALLSALVSSGLGTDKFLFIGFFPKKDGKRKALMQEIKKIKFVHKMTVVVYESPYRILNLLLIIKEVFGNIEVVVSKELTKLHEKTIRQDIEKLIPLFKDPQKGEFVVMF